ncbi:Lnb N-terminal periplasmic domain-containing protein [Lignipirellula cremea]|uniref:Lnb N-terminal periplasmic domain-containing protein n=1 Tax=Lignipirellula cremea TaxID=2528010 RepID=A0A518DWX6_9BACT|nr:DUF4105 domain-containing protein [Lignipirellula cremea]QDU96340.1 hypothetical protein Pla8534_41600 [Lignipirellula cremea]
MGVWSAAFVRLSAALLLGATGCASLDLGPASQPMAATEAMLTNPLFPSNHRNWDPNLAVLPQAEMVGDQITVHNVRNTTYITETDFIVRHYNKTFKMSDVCSVDYCLVPFNDSRALAHTFLSFGLTNGEYLAVSIEVRLEADEEYSPVMGSLRQFEIMYVVADERDVVLLRTEHRNCDVFIYPTKATPTQAQAVLRDLLDRVNELVVQPEFYDSLTNNCTTNIMRPLNKHMPQRLTYDYRMLLPGYSAQLAYDAGLLDTQFSYVEATTRARVTDRAHRYKDDPDFSRKIRGY